MKRRSARPFMVEVKQTRSARTSLTATEARPRPDKILWPELAQAALEPPAPAPAPVDEAPAQSPPAAPGPGPSPRSSAGRSSAGRRTNELRLGERWKRRLPHFMR
ncbi:hypothetical protein [Methylobacterium mesophilicum]|uniref:hypothetical protein n=1 Tax=Methylobacterium mesophilicum TaxID=39956 RepID=UPI002F2F26BA